MKGFDGCEPMVRIPGDPLGQTVAPVLGVGAGHNLRFPDGVHLTPHDFQLGDATRTCRVGDLGGTIGDMTVTGRATAGSMDTNSTGR